MSETSMPWISEQFAPHGSSLGWLPSILWLNVVVDVLIALAYFTIPFLLFHIARRRKDLPLDWLVLSFAVFASACGLMHLMSAWNLWHTHYWAEVALKVIATAAAIPTAILLWRSLPDILSLPSQRQLRDANESLARANHELEAFTASVSHDLRSPLTTIAGQAGLLELSIGSSASDDQKRRLQRIQSSVKQMSELIDALLVLSRISRHTLHREIVDVSAIAETALADLRQRDPQRNVESAIQPNMKVHGDRRLISDVFANLISNAWKFTAKIDHPRIEIGQSVNGAMSTLFVRDNGAGFDMAYAPKLFKPFQRLHGPSEFEGSGVGLATVARIIDRHGGRIWTEAKPNQGAVFYFTLPTLPLTDELLIGTQAAPTSQLAH